MESKRRFLRACKPKSCPRCGAQGNSWRGHGWRERKISVAKQALTEHVPVYRVRCFACKTVWQIQPAQILRYRRYSTAQVGAVLERRAAGESFLKLQHTFPGLSGSVSRDWVSSCRRGVSGLLTDLVSWASKNILTWSPPSGLNDGGLRALLSVVASIQEADACPSSWLEWLQNWTCVTGQICRIPATTFCAGRGP